MIKAKVCGINNSENLKSLLTLPVDMIGFIFDKSSERNCILSPEEVIKAFSNKTLTCKKVGIFTDAPLTEVLQKHEEYDLDYIQLNGKENIFYCQLLREHQLKLIKTFSIDNNFCFSNTSAYSFFCDYFVFDYDRHKEDASSESFDYSNLRKYKGKKPYFLSSDFGLNDVEVIRDIESKLLSFVNLNQAFEIQPGYKNLDLVADFIYRIKRPESFSTNRKMKRASNGF